MSADVLELISSNLERDGIKYVMHTSRTDDNLKNELEDVNNFWIKYQVVLYSPTIESGVDFNKEHFDKIYCIIKNGQMTCSQRAFLQMVGRIRHVGDPIINCYYKGPVILDSAIYIYDDVLSYFRYYEELNGKKIIENVNYTKIIKNGMVKMIRDKTDVSLFDHISIYNEVEQLNKNLVIFMTVLKIIEETDQEEQERIKPNYYSDMMEFMKMISDHNRELLKKDIKKRELEVVVV